MKKRVYVLPILIILMLFLSACNQGLAAYKEDAKQQLEDYAVAKGQDCYNAEEWTAICNGVAQGKIEIDKATSKVDVDIALAEAMQAINEAEKGKIIPMEGAEVYSEGCGTENNPYIISNRGNLIHFSNQINNGENTSAYFALGADIDLENIEWTPIGIITANYNGGNCFYGVFDGKGYEVSNFCITVRQKNTRAENIGLFGYNAGTIRNFGVVDFDIDITWQYHLGYIWSVSAGGLAGRNVGSIANCYAIGNINLEYSGRSTSVSTSPSHVNAGGLVGSGSYASSNGIITDCYAVVDVSAKCSDEPDGSVYAAGLVAGGNAKNCFATGDVSSNKNSFPSGGASSFGAGDISNSYAYEGQVVSGTPWGPRLPSCTSEELNDPAFYTDKLGWSKESWCLENLSFEDGKYAEGRHPKLKRA